MLIDKGNLKRDMLKGQVAIVTGAGSGIGYEAARALIWLGAVVVIAEINAKTGKAAASQLNAELGQGNAIFIHTDIGNERSIQRMSRQVLRQMGKVDIVLHNATVTPLGAVKDVPAEKWDWSYRVNLRGPVVLTQAFLPGMLERNYGVLVSVSSYAPAYMGAYEIFKKAQTELANTLDAELQGTGVIAFTIGPGYVPTETARTGIETVARLYGKDPAEFYEMVKPQTLSAEAAGVGFAAAIAYASQFRGQEIASIVGLSAAGIDLSGPDASQTGRVFTPEEMEHILSLAQVVHATLEEHVRSWNDFSIFQKQWLVSTFQKDAGMAGGRWLQTLQVLIDQAKAHDSAGILAGQVPLQNLAKYYAGLYERGKSFIKDPIQREEQLGVVSGWQAEVERLAAALEQIRSS